MYFLRSLHFGFFRIENIFTNGVLDKFYRLKQPSEKLLLDICKTPDDMKLSTWDFVATFGIILFGYVSSSLLLCGEYFYRLKKQVNSLATSPAKRPATRPATRPSTSPATRPATRSATRRQRTRQRDLKRARERARERALHRALQSALQRALQRA
jgi:hypothetical protein